MRFSSIGDIVLASPFIRALRKTFPDSQTDFLVKSEYAELVKYNPYLSSVIELHGSDRNELRDLKKQIRTQHYDAIFDIHNSHRSRYLRLFSDAKHVRVVNKRVVARFMLVKLKWRLYPGSIPSVAERYIETAREFGVDNDNKGLEIFIPGEQSSAVSALMSKHQLEKFLHIIGIVPASKHFTKRWLPERFVELGIELTKKGNTKLLVFGGKEDAEYCGDITQMINARAGWTAAESFAGKFSLLETASAFDACHLVVTNDTGLMHLAAARKRKVIAIFGSTVHEFGFFPYGTENIVLERKDLSCRPCTHIGLPECPRGHFRCMKDIQHGEVFSAAQLLLRSETMNDMVHHA